MIKLVINQNDVKKLVSELKRIRDLSRPLNQIGKSLEASTKLRFNEGVSPENQTWKPSRRALRENNRTLVDTGKLQKSITYDSDDKEVTVGTNVEYAEKHQLGEDGLPVRAFLGISKRDEKEILEIIEKHIE